MAARRLWTLGPGARLILHPSGSSPVMLLVRRCFVQSGTGEPAFTDLSGAVTAPWRLLTRSNGAYRASSRPDPCNRSQCSHCTFARVGSIAIIENYLRLCLSGDGYKKLGDYEENVPCAGLRSGDSFPVQPVLPQPQGPPSP